MTLLLPAALFAFTVQGPAPRPFLGTFEVPATRRAETLRWLHERGYRGARTPDWVAPETILYRGPKAEFEAADTALWELRYQWEGRPASVPERRSAPSRVPPLRRSSAVSLTPARLAVALAALALLSAAARADDLKDLAGAWNVVAETFDGEEVPEDVATKFLFTFKGQRVTMRGGLAKAGDRFIPIARQDTYAVTLGTDGDLKIIDLVIEGRKTIPGLYKFDGKKLVLCLNFAGNRPKEFESKGQTGTALITLERKK